MNSALENQPSAELAPWRVPSEQAAAFRAWVAQLVSDEVRSQIAALDSSAKPAKAPLRRLDAPDSRPYLASFRNRMTDALTNWTIVELKSLRDGGFVATPNMFDPADAKKIAAQLQPSDLGDNLPAASWAPLLQEAETARRQELEQARANQAAGQRRNEADLERERAKRASWET